MIETTEARDLRRALDRIDAMQAALDKLSRRVATLEAAAGKPHKSAKRMTLAQAAAYTGMSSKLLRRTCLQGKLAYLRAGDGPTAKILIRVVDLTAWLTAHRNMAALSPREWAECKRQAR